MYPPLFFLALSVLALVTRTKAATCCSQLAAAVPGTVLYPNSSAYVVQTHDYWSFTEWLEPACVFMPNSTVDASLALKLFSENDCAFSIKGAGHSAVPGAANINNGIALITRNLDQRTIDFEAGNVRVGAGNHIGDLYSMLDAHNLSTVMGRYEKVGMGLLVGAGLSFFNNRDGLAVDNVLSYEVVLANGTVLDTSTESHAELHRALKGGNNNFGVVTSYLLRTFSIPGGVYGGLITYPESSLDQMNNVIYDYHTKGAVEDVLTHVLPQYGFNGTTNETINFSPVIYNARVDKLPPSLSGFETTPHTNSTMRFTTYAALAEEYNAGFPDGQMQEQRVFTVYADREFFKDVWYNFRVFLQNYRDVEGFYGLHCNMPITAHARAQGEAKGHNSLGQEGSKNETLSILYFGVSFDNPDDADRVFSDHEAFVNSMRALAEARGVLHRYLMLTYAGNAQPVIQSYGQESVARLKAVQKAYDPDLIFQRLAIGGHKLPVAGT